MLPQVGADREVGDQRAVRRRGDHDQPLDVARIVVRILDARAGDQAAHRMANEHDAALGMPRGEPPQLARKQLRGGWDV